MGYYRLNRHIQHEDMWLLNKNIKALDIVKYLDIYTGSNMYIIIMKLDELNFKNGQDIIDN